MKGSDYRNKRGTQGSQVNTSQSFRNAKSMNLRGEEKPFNVSQATLDEIDAKANSSVRSEAETMPEGDERDFMALNEHGAPIGQEIGYCYLGSPIIVDPGANRPDVRVAKYVPNASPGSRAPHLWLIGKDKRISTIELFGLGFQLLVNGPGSVWKEAVNTAGLSDTVNVINIGDGLDYTPEDASFGKIYGIEADGAVLVRPDGHVVFRSETCPPDGLEPLSHAVKTAFGHSIRKAA